MKIAWWVIYLVWRNADLAQCMFARFQLCELLDL